MEVYEKEFECVMEHERERKGIGVKERVIVQACVCEIEIRDEMVPRTSFKRCQTRAGEPWFSGYGIRLMFKRSWV